MLANQPRFEVIEGGRGVGIGMKSGVLPVPEACVEAALKVLQGLEEPQ